MYLHIVFIILNRHGGLPKVNCLEMADYQWVNYQAADYQESTVIQAIS